MGNKQKNKTGEKKMSNENANTDVAAFLNELKELQPERPARQLVNYEPSSQRWTMYTVDTL